jgi:hypothetical protein
MAKQSEICVVVPAFNEGRRLYQDEVRWTRLRENALGRIRKHCDPIRFRKTIERIIDATRMPTMPC